MLTLFSLRLALGMLGALLLLSPAEVNPRFYRTHFLTTLGLGAVALVLLWGPAAGILKGLLIGTLLLAFLGSSAWSIEGAPGGRTLIVLTLAILGGTLFLAQQAIPPRLAPAVAAQAGLWLAADSLTSAALLGMALSAMLMGHSYLIAPSMSLRPLRSLLLGLFVSLVLRMALAGAGLWFWTAGRSLANLTVVALLWLPLRWGLGFALPLVLAVLAWKTLRIPNTQSATGILYIAVVFVFLGELTAQLLLNETGYFL
jgi:hypothetical protein